MFTKPMPSDTMTSRLPRWPALLALALGCLVGATTPAVLAADAPVEKARRQHGQPAYATPDEAVKALVAAVRLADARRTHEVLGPGTHKLVLSGDPVADQQSRDRFIDSFDKRSRIEMKGDARATLLIGEKDWPFPFPLVKRAAGWQFDSRAGAEEILNRRIGRNELAAMQVCLAYVDAQREYAQTEGHRYGAPSYAMKLVSTEGNRDGLYWRTGEGEPPSPFGPLASKAGKEGYGKGATALNEPYHGYYYRILTRQGSHAPGGAYDYVVDGRMIGGFALVAYPARWGASGVMTFLVNHDGVVYQKNLGKGTGSAALGMTSFDPDSSWTKVEP
ncbi:MAG: DUF2950 domain-containing protein [Betaproteobacteria bacterium]|nr:DUF2950 domain-containing protein [Betaproteobacteria bacterium]